MSIGDRIRELRIKLDIPQIELAENCNISKQTLYKYENNIVTNIPSDKIELLAKYLRTSPAYLMGWEEFEASIREKANRDVALAKMNERIKIYALKLAELSHDKQEHVMNLIDMLDEK